MFINLHSEKMVWPCVKFSAGEGTLSSQFVSELADYGRRVMSKPANLLTPQDRVCLISDWAVRWRNPYSPWRKKARLLLPESVRLSRPMIEMCLDLFFRSIKTDQLKRLIGQFAPKQPQLIGHILPGNVLAASVESFLAEIVLGNFNIIKASSRSPVFPLLVVETLGEMDARLKPYVSLLCWKGGEASLDAALISGVDRLIVYGAKDTIEQVKMTASQRADIDEFGPGFSVGVIDKDSAKKKDLTALAWKAALDTSIYDQRGCLSLQTVFVERGGDFSPEEFAYAFAKALSELESQYPLGELTVREAGVIRARRNKWLIRELMDEEVFQISDRYGRYTVLFEPVLSMDQAVSGRMVTVRPFLNTTELSEFFSGHKPGFQGFALANLTQSESWQGHDIVRVAEFGSLHSTMLGWQKFPFSKAHVTAQK